jgi:hypothetical protein
LFSESALVLLIRFFFAKLTELLSAAEIVKCHAAELPAPRCVRARSAPTTPFVADCLCDIARSARRSMEPPNELLSIDGRATALAAFFCLRVLGAFFSIRFRSSQIAFWPAVTRCTRPLPKSPAR